MEALFDETDGTEKAPYFLAFIGLPYHQYGFRKIVALLELLLVHNSTNIW